MSNNPAILRRPARATAWSISLGLAAVLVAGCGEQASTSSADDSSSAAPAAAGQATLSKEGVATIQRLRDSIGAQYITWSSVPEMAAQASVIVTGTVAAVLPGRSTIETSTDGGIRTRISTLIVKVKVDEKIAVKAPEAIVDGYVYLSQMRALNDVDENGKVIGADTYPTVEELQAAIPAGTRVAIAVTPDARILELPPIAKVETDPNPLPRGAVFLPGDSPQAVVYDQGPGDLDAELTYWRDLSFDDLVKQLRG